MSNAHVIVLRPAPGHASTLTKAHKAGLSAIASAIFEILPIAWQPPEPAEFDALLIGSANAILHGGAGLAQLRDLPVYAVGDATARVAADAGFAVTATGTGGLQQLLRQGPTRFLRLAGVERVTLEPPAGVRIETRVVYTTRPLKLTNEALAAAAGGAVVLLHSAAAAREFARQFDAAGIGRERALLACLGARIAEAAGAGWYACRSATMPSDSALLELAAQMCQTTAVGVDQQDRANAG